jgi:hypothetical protein
MVSFDVDGRGGRPGSGADCIFVGSGDRRLSCWGRRRLDGGETLNGVQLQEVNYFDQVQ